MPKAYRQKFKNFQKRRIQTYVEFAREKALLFDNWTAVSKATNQDSLRELMLSEDFKNCLPDHAAVYLNECKVTNSFSSCCVR